MSQALVARLDQTTAACSEACRLTRGYQGKLVADASAGSVAEVVPVTLVVALISVNSSFVALNWSDSKLRSFRLGRGGAAQTQWFYVPGGIANVFLYDCMPRMSNFGNCRFSII